MEGVRHLRAQETYSSWTKIGWSSAGSCIPNKGHPCHHSHACRTEGVLARRVCALMVTYLSTIPRTPLTCDLLDVWHHVIYLPVMATRRVQVVVTFEVAAALEEPRANATQGFSALTSSVCGE